MALGGQALSHLEQLYHAQDSATGASASRYQAMPALQIALS